MKKSNCDDMKSFIAAALRLTPDWIVRSVRVDQENSKIQIELDFQFVETQEDIVIDSVETTRYLSIFEFQTFITAPVIWKVRGNKREKLSYPWDTGMFSRVSLSRFT